MSTAVDAWSAGAFDAGAFDVDTFQIRLSTEVGITLGGVDARQRMRKYGGPQIRDILNDAPNTCTFAVDGEAPAIGQRVRITIADGVVVLFAGRVQTIEHTFEGTPATVVWRCTAIDDTGQANASRPFRTWTDTSASDIASAITPSGFTAAGVEAGLPAVSITFDGSANTIGCLTQLANLIGGYTKIEDGVVYLFLEDTSAPPDPIDADHPFLFDPPITISTDGSQIRTRVYGKGYGETITADVSASDDLVPIQDGAVFDALGGRIIMARTAEAASSDFYEYAQVIPRGLGTLVGPGAAPGSAPNLALTLGVGVTSGAHDVSVVHVTAAGKTLAGPVATITAGTFAAPTTAPIAAAPTAGPGPDPGSHDYVVTFSALGGETVGGPVSNSVTTSATAGELAPPSSAPIANAVEPGNLVGDTFYEWGLTFMTAAGETTLDPASIVAVNVTTAPAGVYIDLSAIAVGPAGTTGRRIYRRKTDLGGTTAWGRLTTLADNTTTTYTDNAASPSATAPPSTNTTGTMTQRVVVSAIPIGPSGTTARNLYRRFNGVTSFFLLTTIANNTTTTYTDSTANSGLGAAAPGAATAIGNQIALTAIPIGPAAVTQREIYMSPAGGGTRRRVLTIADNTTTTGTITMSDATLAGQITEPGADTSGLQQPPGQVNIGATTIPLASSASFLTTGGWAELGGGQVVRYTGVSGQTLTGVPATGPGAIVAVVNYGSTAVPAPMLTALVPFTVLPLPSEAAAPRSVSHIVRKGSAVHILVIHDDLDARSEHAARTGGSGVVEYMISDGRRGRASLEARCDADLAMFSRPLVTVNYATRDIKTKSGKTVTIDLDSPAISETLTIQEVTISEIDHAPGVMPRFTVTASSVRFSLEDTLRQLIVKE